jgi:hypothetical protein
MNNRFYYRIRPDVALAVYGQNGMTPDFNPALMNGYLLIETTDEDTADKIRKTFTDVTMWERIYEPGAPQPGAMPQPGFLA